jgi:glycerophosphoryl diester phosphodiesterase
MRPARPLVIAHRGASAYRPENTAAAYELAVEQRADMIEVDLHRTRDGAIVVVHDAELAGLGGAGEVADATLAEVRALDAGDGQQVPTLEELLDGWGARIPFNLELKQGRREAYASLEAGALEAVVRRGLLARTLFSSFHDPLLATLRAASPEVRIALLISRRSDFDVFERARALGAEGLNPEAELVTPELVGEAHARGLAVYPFTVDDEARMRQFLAWGVDGLFTNVPDRMRKLVDAAGEEGWRRAR